MTKYEYKIYTCEERDLNSEMLNVSGREEWELVTHSTVATQSDEYGLNIWHYVFFRRPLVTTEDDDGWTYDEWQEHQKNMAKLAREVREILEQ